MPDKTGKYHFYRRASGLKRILDELQSGESSQESRASYLNNGPASERKTVITDSETENALQSVKKQLGHKKFAKSEKKTSREPSKKSVAITRLRYLLAAAVFLIAIGIGYFLMPVRTVVPNGEMITMDLPDGSSVSMNSGTSISYNRLFGIFHRKLDLDGEAYFTVPSSGHPFQVHANETVTEVAGTRFNVRSWSSDPDKLTTVAVNDGVVHFYSGSSKSDQVTISDGMLSRAKTGSKSPTKPEAAEMSNVLAWKDRNFAFTGQPLYVIFSELERRFDQTIEIEDDQIASEYLTAFYTEPDSLENLLNDICTVKGLNYARTANGYRVFM